MTTAHAAALAPTYRLSAKPSALVVITEEAEPPHWAVEWCRQSGREIHTQSPPASSACGLPSGLGPEVARLIGHPVLVVRPTAARPGPPRVVAAIRDLTEDRSVLRSAVKCARYLGAELVVVHGVPRSFAERSVGLDEAVEHGNALLDSAIEQVATDASDLRVSPRLFRVHPHELVSQRLDADLLVVGVSAQRPLSSFDQVATSALYHGYSSVLLVPKRHRAGPLSAHVS